MPLPAGRMLIRPRTQKSLIHFLTVAKVATHGMYKRQNTMRQYAFNELKPIDCNCSAKICIPTSELALTTLNKIAIEETTTSLATIPAIRASTICQKPSPNGANNGLRACPTKRRSCLTWSSENRLTQSAVKPTRQVS